MTDRLVPYALGKTSGSTTELPHLAGYRALFTDDDPTTGPDGAATTAMTVEAIWVRNESGGALNPGAPVTWDTSNLGPGLSIGGNAADDAKTVGVVDPYVSGTVADDYYFWLIVKGPTKVRYDGSSSLTVGTEIKSAGSGNVSLYTFATDDADSKFGVTIEAKTSGTAGDLFRAVIDCSV